MADEFQWPARFVDLKRELAERFAGADYEAQLTDSWRDLLGELALRTKEIAAEGPNHIPQVRFDELDKLTPEQVAVIRRKGSVVIKGVVDDKEAEGWKTSLEEFIKTNPDIDGFPEGDMQFFHLYWTRAQVLARGHPNVLKASAWLNNLYHLGGGESIPGVDMSTPLVYADRFRIRHPGIQWDRHPPHVDGGSIERWEDENFRQCFAEILSGNWRKHDPYELKDRLNARSSLYGRPGQATVFRTFQGWLAMSETAPTQGTLKVFPDVHLSNAYTILRPFFRPTVPLSSPDILDASNWVFDISEPSFPGIVPRETGFHGPRPTPELHPHLRLDETMTSVPKVNPGDMVFWHCDVVHSVEEEHTGMGDSAVMYIGSVPKCPQNDAYVKKQLETFLAGVNPPDYPKLKEGVKYTGLGAESDLVQPVSRVAMGFA